MDFKKLIVFISLIAVGLGAGACGSSSPSAPSQLSGSGSEIPTTGNRATINGAIAGAALNALNLGGGSFASLAGPSLTVTVVGTSITAPVHPNGTFTLTNVPPGDIQLHFTGTGTDAFLTVPGISGGDELRITVEVTGNTATLQNVTRKDKLNKVELEGTVSAGGCSSFTVKNVVVTTDAATVFKNGRCEEIATGVRVHVKATSTGAATALATEVNIQRDADDNGKSGDKDGDSDAAGGAGKGKS